MYAFVIAATQLEGGPAQYSTSLATSFAPHDAMVDAAGKPVYLLHYNQPFSVTARGKRKGCKMNTMLTLKPSCFPGT